MGRYIRLVCLGLLAAASLIVPGARGEAHAVLVESTPANGASLAEPPAAVRLRFSEPVTAAFTPVTVRDSAGRRVDAGDAGVDPRDRTVISVGLPPQPPGLYTAAYRVTSVDGHPVSGSVAFGIGVAVGAPAPTIGPPASEVAAVAALRGAVLALAILLAGLAGFLALVWWPVDGTGGPPGVGRWAAGITLLLMLLDLVGVGLYAVRASGEALTLALVGQALLGTRVGRLTLLRAGLAVVAGAALAARPGTAPVRGLVMVPGAALLLTLSLQSHALATGQLLPVVADWAHLLAAAPWVGGVFGFALVAWPTVRGARGGPAPALLIEIVPRFSRLAASSLLLLTATGVYSALLHLPSWAALAGTAYGRALLVKLALLVPVLALGFYHLRQGGRRPPGRLIRLEAVFMLGVLMAAGLLTTLPPARAELLSRQEAYTADVTRGGLRITLRIDPAQVGFNQAAITLARPDGTPEAGAGVGLRVRMLSHDMGVQNLDARESAPGHYQGEELVFGMDGNWEVEVVALTRGGLEVRHPFPVAVPPPERP